MWTLTFPSLGRTPPKRKKTSSVPVVSEHIRRLTPAALWVLFDFVEGALDFILRLDADHSFDDFSATEKEECRQCINTVSDGQSHTLGGIDLGDSHLIAVFLG